MKSKITIVTGGSSGLGYELSKLISKSENVCLVARDEIKLNNAKDTIQQETTMDVKSFNADVSIENEVQKLFSYLNDYDIARVINCAGAGKFCNPEDINTEMVDELLKSNLLSVIYMSAYAVKVMKENGGTIASILSTAALKGNPQESIYCAMKWGARGYCEALKAAYKGTNIKIVTFCPGGINTPFWKEDCGLTPNVNKFMDPKELAEVIGNALLDRKTLFCPDMLIEKL